MNTSAITTRVVDSARVFQLLESTVLESTVVLNINVINLHDLYTAGITTSIEDDFEFGKVLGTGGFAVRADRGCAG